MTWHDDLQKRFPRIVHIWRISKNKFDAEWKWAMRVHGESRQVRFRRLKHWAKIQAKHATHPRRWWKARKAYADKLNWLREHNPPVDPPPPTGGAGFTLMDGRQVPNWIYRILAEARSTGAWSGYVISGFRTPEYSESLCIHMCGHPTCPGTCAGRYSNHACPPTATGADGEGAVDVSDQFRLEAWCRAHGKPLYGGGYVLPSDTPHFSRTGR